MARTLIAAVVASCALVAVAVSNPPPPVNLPQNQVAVLSGIDQDPGVRLRAYRAIGLYKGIQARTALRFDLTSSLASPQTGTDLLYLRAAIEALGLQQEPADVPVLVPFLNFEASRDIRAATADSLRVLGSSQAIDPLQERYGVETQLDQPSEQVRLAITRALRDLGQPQ